MATTITAPRAPVAPPSLPERKSIGWADFAALAAMVWSLGYAALGLYWTVGGPGYPFGSAADSAEEAAATSMLSSLQADVGAPLIAALSLSGAVIAALMVRDAQASQPRPLRVALRGIGWLFTATLLLVVPEGRLLAVMAYAPVFLVGAPFGWPPANYFDALTWPLLNQGVCVIGGLLWGAATLAAQRRERGACPACGRTDGVPAGWTTPAMAARWGRWAVAVAVAAPLAYAVSRYAWALSIPLGISEDLMRQIEADGMSGAAAGLASVATGGALLTVGLVQRWGEVFPRWVPWLAGRRVPPALAIVPASVVAVVVTAAGIRLVTWHLVNGSHDIDLGAIAPGFLWPAWGVSLGAATLAYYYRRRGRCSRCGRGTPPPELLRITRLTAAARKQQPLGARAALGAGLLAFSVAAATLIPLSDPRLPPAAVAGQAYWDLPTGSRIAYVRIPTASTASNTPVVFLHGGPGTPDMAGDASYFGQFSADGYDVYVYDKVGTGRSTRLSDPREYTLSRDVADVEAIRQQIGASQLILIGHSYGATVAAAYLASYGERVARAVFSSPGGLPPTDAGGGNLIGRLTLGERLGVYALLFHPRALLAYALVQRDPRLARAFFDDAELDARFDAVYNRGRQAVHCHGMPPGPELHGLGFYAHYSAESAASTEPADPRPSLAERSTPALVIKAGCDYQTWSSAVEYVQALPNARFAYLSNAGHNAYQDRPDTFLSIVREFLSGRMVPHQLDATLTPPPDFEGPN